MSQILASASDINTCERIASFEIAPMRNLSQLVGTDREIVTIRPACKGETPDLWSVLARFENGRCAHLADRRDKIRAIAFARRFRRKLRSAEVAAGFELPPRPIAVR